MPLWQSKIKQPRPPNPQKKNNREVISTLAGETMLAISAKKSRESAELIHLRHSQLSLPPKPPSCQNKKNRSFHCKIGCETSLKK